MRLAAIFTAGLALLLPSAAIAQSSPEERVLLEMFFAKKASTVEAHLPEAFRKVLRDLSPEDRADFEKAILIRNQVCDEAKCKVPSDGHALLTVERRGEMGSEVEIVDIKLRRHLSDGRDAVLQLEATAGEQRVETIQIWMNVEEGVWRLTEIRGPYGQEVTFDKRFAESLVHARLSANESSAVGNMRTLNTSLVTYASTYPQVGFADSLHALGGDGGSEMGAGLIDAVLESGEKSGYHFEYHRPTNETYAIVARPTSYGLTGTRSFFTDQSGVIRFTTEDRAATASDPPLQ